MTLTRADASAVDAASQLCDSLASLDAVADALFSGLRARTDSQRGACVLRLDLSSAANERYLPTQAGWRRSGRGCVRRDSAWTP